jgi:hypothetical protein
MDFLLCLLAGVFGGLRVLGNTSQAFQGFAHIYVGGLIGAWLVKRRPLYGGLALGLSVLEVLCFLYFRFLR